MGGSEMTRLCCSRPWACLSGPAHRPRKPADAIRPITLLTQPQAAAAAGVPGGRRSSPSVAQAGADGECAPAAGPAVQPGHLVRAQRWDVTTWRDGRPAGAQRSGRADLQPVRFGQCRQRLRLRRLQQSRIRQAGRRSSARSSTSTSAKALIMQAQEMINHDQPYGFLVHPEERRRLQQDGLGSEEHGRRRPASASATSGPGSASSRSARRRT